MTALELGILLCRVAEIAGYVLLIGTAYASLTGRIGGA